MNSRKPLRRDNKLRVWSAVSALVSLPVGVAAVNGVLAAIILVTVVLPFITMGFYFAANLVETRGHRG